MAKKPFISALESGLRLEAVVRAVSERKLHRREGWWRGSDPAPGCRRLAL